MRVINQDIVLISDNAIGETHSDALVKVILLVEHHRVDYYTYTGKDAYGDIK